MSDTGSYRSDAEDTLQRTVTPARSTDTVRFCSCYPLPMSIENFFENFIFAIEEIC